MGSQTSLIESGKSDAVMDDTNTLRKGTDYKLVNKKPFTKAVAKAYDDTGLGLKFGQYHDRWQERLIRFAKKVREIDA